MLQIKTTIEINELPEPKFAIGDVVRLGKMSWRKQFTRCLINEIDLHSNRYNTFFDQLRTFSSSKIVFVIVDSFISDGQIAYTIKLADERIKIDWKINVYEEDLTQKCINQKMIWYAEEQLKLDVYDEFLKGNISVLLNNDNEEIELFEEFLKVRHYFSNKNREICFERIKNRLKFESKVYLHCEFGLLNDYYGSDKPRMHIETVQSMIYKSTR